MAIPVGMVLPEKFSQIDLKSLSKQSEVLIERYRKQPSASAAPLSGSSVDATLAKALESLAHTIGHLDERLARQERKAGGEPEVVEDEALPEGGSPAGGEAAQQENPDEEVLQLNAEEKKQKAEPLKASVLVRREAAQEAHKFQRRKQSEVDHRGREQVERGFFQTLMEKAPKTTMFVSLLFVVGLTGGMIWWMSPSYQAGERVTLIEPTKKTALGQLWDDDPEAGHAEAIAKAYLNATSPKAAAPFVYESEALGEKFTRLYRPISTPEDYEIELKSRMRVADGEGSVFAYRVTTGDGESRMLVVVPEGKMPKVFWEFFAEVGDMSWDQFMEERPAEPTAMRVWLEPSNEYFSPYNPDRWTAFIAHDYEDSFTLHAFVERGTGVEWKLKNALETEPRKFGRRNAIMAHLKLTFMSELDQVQGARIFVAEIKEVMATDWLPERFRHTEGRRVEATEAPE